MKRHALEHRSSGDERRQGFTLLETVITAGLLALVVGNAMNIWFHSQVAFAESIQQNVVNDMGQRLRTRLGADLMSADPGTLLPVAIIDSDFVQFQNVLGYDAGAKILGPVITVGFQLETGEVANGTDDNGDGRIDEGYVTYTEAGGPTIGIGGNVVDIKFNAIPNGISVAIAVAIVDRDGVLVQETFTRVIAFRN